MAVDIVPIRNMKTLTANLFCTIQNKQEIHGFKAYLRHLRLLWNTYWLARDSKKGVKEIQAGKGIELHSLRDLM
ncbi:MAG: hypothetical protein HW383_541 [Candidatus Magasanikbacteria bacterium]|nr:hypothetical protein [Candidatus Magasanikbacteria bacterium]